jgi:hypothetical protein
MSNDLELANRAIGLCGGEPITAFDTSTPLSEFAALEWADTKAWLLASHRWVFAAHFAQLTKLAVAPAGCPLQFAFQRPADLAGAIHAFRNGPDLRTSIEVAAVQADEYIACDWDPLWIEYTRNVDVATAPSWFTECLKIIFASKVAPRVGRRAMAADFELEAFGPPEMNRQGGLWLQAVQADSRNAPQRSLAYASGGALTDARFGVGVGLGAGGQVNNGFPFIIEV